MGWRMWARSQYSCGRNGEAPSQLLGDQLRTLGLNWTRLKTGTPPRLDGRTIDWTKFEPQPGDVESDAVFVSDGEDRPGADPVPHRIHHGGDAADLERGDSAVAAL